MECEPWMRRKARVWWAVAGIALASLLGAVAIYDVHFRNRGVIVLHGDDPRVLVSDASGFPHIGVWGVLRYDEQTRCLYLETSSDHRHPEVFDRPLAVVWPIGSRPAVVDGRPGVRVGGFLGRFGGEVDFPGDILVGQGVGIGFVRQPTKRPGPNCYEGTLWVGHVERVTELPRTGIFDPLGPEPLYQEYPVVDLAQVHRVIVA